MPTPKSLSGYPDWFFTIAERAQKPEYHEEIELTSRGAAINLRQRFYSFRQLLTEAGHPHSAGTLELVLSIREHTLVFSKVAALTPAAMQQLGLKPSETINAGAANAPDRIEVSDAAEAQLEALLRGNSLVMHEVDQGPNVDTKSVTYKPAEGGKLDVRPPMVMAEEKCPPHEWDPAQTCCLKCGVPYAT